MVLHAANDAEGVLGVLRTPKWSFRHPQGVQISQGVQMGVQIIQLYMSVWYTDLHNNIIHCSHFGAFYWFIKDVFEVLFSACLIFWGILLICIHLDTL